PYAKNTRATITIRQMPRTTTSHSAPRIWNALAMGPRAERSERYFMVAWARPGDASRFRRGDFSRRAVRVRATDRRVTHAVLETAVLALDPESSCKGVPVPRRLAAPRARLRVERAHGPPIVEPVLKVCAQNGRLARVAFTRKDWPRRSASMSIASPIARSCSPSTRSATPPRARPPRDVRTSPTWRPADSAGDPDVTSARNTPWRLVIP